MRVCIIGCSNRGIETAISLSEVGHEVICIDTNDYKISNAKNGIVDTLDAKLEDKFNNSIKKQKIKLDTEFKEGTNADIFIIAVNTFDKANNEPNNSNLYNALNQITSSITKYTTIAIMSDVIISDFNSFKSQFQKNNSISFDIVFWPYFRNNYSQNHDDRHLILGTSSKQAINTFENLYKNTNKKLIIYNETTAQLLKYASSAYIAINISFANEIKNLTKRLGADFKDILRYIIQCNSEAFNNKLEFAGFYDDKIANDCTILNKIADNFCTDLNIIKASKITNENQVRRFISKLLKYYNYNIEGKHICIWINNNNPGESHILNTIQNAISNHGACYRVFNAATNTCDQEYKDKYTALSESSALVILDYADEYKIANLELIAKNLIDKVIFDANNLYSNKKVSEYNLIYKHTGTNNEEQY